MQGIGGILVHSDKEYTERNPTGIWGKIVCSQCESLFGPWDNTAIEFFKDPRWLDPQAKNKEQFILFRDYDYTKLKLFSLSLLWRADACKHKMYGSVDIGDTHREKLGKMLLAKTPGTPQEYRVMLWLRRENRARFISTPYKSKIEQISFYIFPILNLDIYIKCSSNHLTDKLDQFLSTDKPMRIYLYNFEF